MRRCREHPRPAGRVREGLVEEALPDAVALLFGEDAVGGEIPEVVAVLGDREADDLAPVFGDPAAVRIDLEEVAHALDPLRPCSGRAWLRLRLANPAGAPLGVEEQPVRGPLGRLEIEVAHRTDLDGRRTVMFGRFGER